MLLIDGKKISDKILAGLADEIKNRNLKLRLAGILVGENPSSKKFLELKQKACEKIGIDFRLYNFPETITNSRLRKELNKICKIKNNNGVILELPLPSHLNTQYLLNAVPEEKDVDVLSQKAQSSFFTNKSKILPPSVETVRIILEELNVYPKGKTIAVFGYGLLVGKPISHWLAQQMATVSIINEWTENPEKLSQNADIIISGVGKTNLIKNDMVKNGAIVIDFGFNEALHNSQKSITGDVDFDNVSKKASAITPVPGGVGPIVIASVLKNLILMNAEK